MKSVFIGLICLFIIGLSFTAAYSQPRHHASRPQPRHSPPQGRIYIEPQRHLHYAPCTLCCPETAWHEHDPNEPFLKDFDTRKSYGRVWVNGYYCANGDFVEGHWHFLEEDNSSQASNPDPEPLNPPLNTATENSLEEQYSSTMVSEGNVWVRPYYDRGVLVPGHWRKLPDEKE